MPTPGYVFKDGGTTPPAVDGPVESADASPHGAQRDHAQAPYMTRPPPHDDHATASEPSLQNKAHTFVSDSTDRLRRNFAPDSHELAHENADIAGAVQTHEAREAANGVRDIGWHKPTAEIPDPLVGGLSNGELWAMIRRFNKDVFDVRRVPTEAASGLDLNEAWTEDHSTDKLTLHLQRGYLSIVLGFASLGKQVSRLRSWKETRRTTSFCIVYFAAWAVDLLVPLLLGTLAVLVASKPSRNFLFPPAPLALVSIKTGGIQKPQAGELGTSNTLTGAPEKQEGEAVEEEAANFVNNARHVMMRSFGMHEKQEKEGDPLEGKVPKPIRNVVKAVKAEGSAPGHATDNTDQTQQPMEELLWSKAKPENITPLMKMAPHAVGEIVDNWERFANAIVPTAPFSRISFIRIDAVLLPLFLMSLFIDYYMIYKGVGFVIGLGLFGDPILTLFLKLLNRNCPNWIELLEPKNNILRGVPTNSQLTLTLLRIGEAHNTPIPPIPTSKPDDPNHPNLKDVDKVPLNASRAEIVDAIQPSSDAKTPPGNKVDNEKETGPKHKHLSKIIRVFKGNTKYAVETKLAADHALAAVGSEKAKGHLGVLPKPKNLVYAGPSEFKARFSGKKGWLYITESATPYLTFTSKQGIDHKDMDTIFKIAVQDIKRLKRATTFVGKAAEMAADWSSDKELLGSVEIDDESGKTWRLTALPERDELFNRLVAISSQRWENM